MDPCVQLRMLTCQICDVRINFAGSVSLSLARLLAADTWKLAIIASLEFLLHASQPLLFQNFVIRDLLQNCFLIQALLQIVVVIVNLIYTIRLSLLFSTR